MRLQCISRTVPVADAEVGTMPDDCFSPRAPGWYEGHSVIRKAGIAFGLAFLDFSGTNRILDRTSRTAIVTPPPPPPPPSHGRRQTRNVSLQVYGRVIWHCQRESKVFLLVLCGTALR